MSGKDRKLGQIPNEDRIELLREWDMMEKRINIAMGILAVAILGVFLLMGTPKPDSGVQDPGKQTDKDSKVRQTSFVHRDTERIKKYREFTGLNMEKADIRLTFEGKPLELLTPVYVDSTNRYFFPLSEIVELLDGTISKGGTGITVNLPWTSETIDLDKGDFRTAEQNYRLKKKPLVVNDIVYLSMFDVHRLLNLKVRWGKDNKTIALYKNREQPTRAATAKAGKPALIRLEDVVAAGYYSGTEQLEKLRAVADYLSSEDIPFHIAWIPRYISANSDNDISKQNSFDNADFVFTMDYMQERKGIIGLHGYTHQYGNSESVGGVEFYGQGIPRTKEYVEGRLQLAMDSAKRLDFPFEFFEAPHYAILTDQLGVVEQHFDYVYEHYPKVYGKIVERAAGKRKVKYIPTPLDYVDGKQDAKRMIAKIKNLSPGLVGSFFYHPYIEFEDIALGAEVDGYPTYKYSETSALHQLLPAFKEKGFKFVTIKDI